MNKLFARSILIIIAVFFLFGAACTSKKIVSPAAPAMKDTWVKELTYKAEWDGVKKLIDEQKYQEASQKVQEILDRAKGEVNKSEWTRALIKQTLLKLGLHEYEKAIQFLKEEKWPEGYLSQVMLNLFYAQLLEDYKNMYNWEIRQREQVESKGIADLKKWTFDQINEEIQSTYAEVWKYRQPLGEEPINTLDEFIKKNTYPENIRGTLRDFLSYRYAEVLKEQLHWEPGQDTNLNNLISGIPLDENSSALSDKKAPEIEKTSAILSDLEKWHLGKDQKEAAFNARLQRLSILHGYFSDSEDRKQIKADLENSLKSIRDKEWWGMGMAELAEFIQGEETPDNLIRAHVIAKDCLGAFPGSPGAARCLNIMETIEGPDYYMSSMATDAPNKPSIEIRYRNLTKLYFRAYPINVLNQIKNAKDYYIFPRWKELEKLLTEKPAFEWSLDLPKGVDFKEHKHFVTPPIKDIGTYIIVSSGKEDFGKTDNSILSVEIVLSNMVIIKEVRNDGGIDVTVVSGDTGKPVQDAEVSLYRYDYKLGHQFLGYQLVETIRTNKDGLSGFSSPSSERYSSYFLVAAKDSDLTLDLSYLGLYPRQPDLTESKSSLIYTDRSIYRPLQKIQWKVISYRGNAWKASFATIPNDTITIELLDSNSQVVSSKKVTTNSFGSASGEFTIPDGRMLGRWTLRSTPSQGYAGIQVEEYKRPTFEAKIKDPEIELKINKEATVKGEANYYFGLPVTSGDVKWTVNRQPIFPNSCCDEYFDISSPPEVIAAGSTKLGDDGTFTIAFTPTADEKLSKKYKNLSFSFNILAEITDEGGETRSASKTIRLGFVTVDVTVDIGKNLLIEGEQSKVKFVRSNLNGLPAPGNGKWRITELKQPATVPLPADLPLTKSANAIEPNPYALPEDTQRGRSDTQYTPGNVIGSWGSGDVKKDGDLIHNDKGEIEVELPELTAGAYRIYYETVDSFGEKFELQKEFIVASKKMPLSLPLFLSVDKETFKVGESAKIAVHSGLPDQTIIYEIFSSGKSIEKRLINASSSDSIIELPITEQHRGGFNISATAVRDHQFMQQTQRIFVPWDDRELKVEFATFRDKLRPGAKETFKVTVKNPKGEGVFTKAVELLAYMYDKSLDFFTPHSYPNPLSLLPNRTSFQAATSNLRADTGTSVISDGFKYPAQFKSFLDDALIGLDGYGIGGPGYRGYDSAVYLAEADTGGEPEAKGETEGLMPSKAAPLPVPMARAPSVSEAVVAQAAELTGDGKGPVLGLRSNFAETAFWKPHLTLDKDGTVSFEFTVPDSVTEWNVWAHAITTDLNAGSVKMETKSTKDLMVRPYIPRFLREGDLAEIKIVINNASDKELTGNLDFDIIDPQTELSIVKDFGLKPEDVTGKPFTVAAGKGTNLTFNIKTPNKVDSIAFKAVAKSGDISDGEIRPLPILPGRMHLAQSRFVTLKDKDKRTMTFDDLAKGDDATFINEQMVVTLDAQLFYSVLESLPYLINYPYECTEQTLNRFISTGIIATLYKQYPSIAKMAEEMSKRETPYEKWDKGDPNRKMGLEETPWLIDAKGGKDADYGLVNVLNPKITEAEKVVSMKKLKDAQTAIGGFPWFSGGPPSPFMTLYILHGFSKALEFGVDVPKDMIVKAWSYVHKHYLDELVNLMMKDDCCWEFITLINYVLSNYPDSSWWGNAFSDVNRQTMLDHSFKHWKAHSPYLKGYLALTLKRMGRTDDAILVWSSVMDSAKSTVDEGTFWAPEDRSWLWYNDTIETHAFAIRTLLELTPTDARLPGLVQWIFLNKKLNHWKSTRATAEVIYALIHYLKQTSQLGIREDAIVEIGPQKTRFIFEPDKYTGKKNQIVIPGKDIDPKTMSTVSVEKEGKGMMFASATWNFSTEKLPVTEKGDFFTIKRSYFKREGTSSGFVLKPISEGTPVKVGDQIEVQVSIQTKHPSEYVHLRDPRPSGFEPESTTSKYKWDLGIFWYEEVRDSGQNFFFEHLPQGEYTFKYRIRANMAGSFKVSPATLQSMYAPEFNAYSAGNVVKVETANQ